MNQWMKDKITIGELMVFMNGHINDKLDAETRKKSEFRVKVINELMDYILKYNRKGLAEKIKHLQSKMNVI